MTDRVRVRAHAKLTLSFRVLGRRDDGFHEVEGVLASVARPADTVIIERGGEGEPLEVLGRVAGVPEDASNLVWRAVEAAAGDRSAELRVRLHKEIPPGAGLGGGSADAAAALLGVSRVMPDAATRPGGGGLGALGESLGSDVPFCLSGGLARVTGRGEVVQPLAFVAGWWVAIAVPDIAVSTPAVYAAWDRLGGPSSDRVVEPPGVLEGMVDALSNDLEPAALVVAPELADFRDRWAMEAGVTPILAGSGSAYFVMTDDPAEATAAAEVARSFSELAEASGAQPTGVEIS